MHAPAASPSARPQHLCRRVLASAACGKLARSRRHTQRTAAIEFPGVDVAQATNFERAAESASRHRSGIESSAPRRSPDAVGAGGRRYKFRQSTAGTEHHRGCGIAVDP